MMIGRSRKMAEEQARLDKRTEKKVDPPDLVKKDKENGKGNWLEASRQNFWTILLIIVGIIVFFFGIYTPKMKTPSSSEIESMVWARWIWILVFWGISALNLSLIFGEDLVLRSLGGAGLTPLKHSYILA